MHDPVFYPNGIDPNSIQAVLDIAHDGFWIVNNQLIITYINKKCEEILGFSREEMIGKPLNSFLITEDFDINTLPLNHAENLNQTFEIKLLGKDHHSVWVSISFKVINDEQNHLPGTIITITDISKKKQTEFELAESQRQFRALMDNLPGMAYHCLNDQDWTMEFVNNGCKQLTGYSVDEFIQHAVKYSDIIYNQDKQIVWDSIQMSLELDEPFQVKYRIVTKSGEIKHVFEQGCGIKNNNGEVTTLEGFIIDITQQVEAEMEIRESERRFRNLAQSSKDMIFRYSIENHRFEYISPSSLQITGYSPGEFYYSTQLIDHIIHPQYLTVFQNYWHQALVNYDSSEIEIKIIHKNGDFRWVLLKTSLILDEKKNPVALDGTINDITERKKSELRLKESEEKLRSIFNQAAIGIAQVDILTGNLVQANQRFYEIIGYSTPLSNSLNLRDFVFADDLINQKKLLDELINGQIRQFEQEKRYIKKDGSLVWVHITISAMWEKGNAPDYYLAVVEDIQSKKIALQEREEIFQAISQPILILNPDHSIIDANKAALKIMEAETEQLCGFKCNELMHRPDKTIPTSCPVTKIIQEGLRTSIQEETIVNGKPTIVTVTPIFNDNQELDKIIHITTDISELKKSEQVIKESDEKIKSLLDRMIDGIYRSTPEGKFVEVNQAMVDIFGYHSKEELLSINIGKDLYIDETERNSEYPDTGIEQGTIFGMKKKDGSIIYVEDSGNYIKDENGTVIYHEGILRDVTERIANEKEILINKERFKSLYELSKFSGENENDLIKYCLEVLVNLTHSNVGLLHLFRNDNPTFIYNSQTNEAGEKSIFFDTKVLTIENTEIWKRVSTSQNPLIINDSNIIESIKDFLESHLNLSRLLLVPVIEQGKVVLITAVGNKFDPYEESDAEHMSLFINEVWKMIQKIRTEEELKEAKKRAEESDRLKSSLLNNMSHELRTPMNGILGFSELLTEQLDDKELKGMADNIYLSGRRLLTTLNSLMNLAQIESDSTIIKPREVCLSLIIEQVFETYLSVAREKNLTLLPKILPGVFAFVDPDLFQQVISQLIDNAIKYTPKGKVIVELTLSDEEGTQNAVFNTIDEGIGIAPEHKDLIFQAFRQVSEGIGRAFEGTGLGLTLCKKFTDMMNGTITFTSQLNIGSTFTVIFPVTHVEIYLPSASETVVEEEIELPMQKGLKILVVEDNYINMELLVLHLSSFGEVLCAYDGESALEIATKETIDLFLMDINLGPGMDGLMVTNELRKYTAYKQTPIIAVTGYTTREEREKILSSGFTHFIAKPYDEKALHELVSQVITTL